MRYMWPVFFILSILGCQRQDDERTIHIAVSLAGDDVFSTTQYIQGIEDAGKEKNISVRWRVARMNQEKQILQIDTLLAYKPDILIVELVDTKTGGSLLTSAKQTEVPIIGFNRIASDFKYDLLVMPDYHVIGREIGSLVRNIYGQKEKILVIEGRSFSATKSLLVKGFSGSANQSDNVTVIKIDAFATKNDTGDRLELLRRLSDIIPNIDIAITTDAVTTRQLAEFLVAPEKGESILQTPPIVGFGDREVFLDMNIDFGNLFLVNLKPYTAGIELIRAANKYARGAFRHFDGPVFRLNGYMIPVVYTSHRIDAPAVRQ